MIDERKRLGETHYGRIAYQIQAAREAVAIASEFLVLTECYEAFDPDDRLNKWDGIYLRRLSDDLRKLSETLGENRTKRYDL